MWEETKELTKIHVKPAEEEPPVIPKGLADELEGVES
jgi:hypothetical protein